MHIHILGICGTFMGGLALIARELGHKVTGVDENVYPPMSTQLASQGIELYEGYSEDNLKPRPDVIVVGNALSRGNRELESVLNQGIRYTSGAQWLAENVLYENRWVLAVAGTHGKTTASSMLAWILEYAKCSPGFLIGGVPENFGVSARLGGSEFFVIEADEYDTAFFDKRSKFIHYRPRTTILNNLEFDHADIFTDLDEIKKQFHHLVRTLPASGQLIVNGSDDNLESLIEMGCWTPIEFFDNSSHWVAEPVKPDCSEFQVVHDGKLMAKVRWPLIGRHNMLNGLAAIIAARHAGTPVEVSADALADFKSVKRRLEVRGQIKGITVYDDFAHHPTAIAATLEALRAHIGEQRLLVALEPRSNTMRMGTHRDVLGASLAEADRVYLVSPSGMSWDIGSVKTELGAKAECFSDVDATVSALAGELKPDDHIVMMSNGSFGNIHEKLIAALESRQ
ncbi:MAG: UDP-N-acetylmuramate:L-alanyl-gamma-D-glutamyl-meso-diaminopimelate ligase [Gammaproteobacteria bacterium]|nr:MAG: UDP-N-acetylmuramate:L-alanyl-gamma-D-glutamyl-meso-diaminopimelate ligase [Gammaproteobacteria bacterium]